MLQEIFILQHFLVALKRYFPFVLKKFRNFAYQISNQNGGHYNGCVLRSNALYFNVLQVQTSFHVVTAYVKVYLYDGFMYDSLALKMCNTIRLDR